jgi:hypothetical protein
MACFARFKARTDTRVVDVVTTLLLRAPFSSRFIPSVAVISIKMSKIALLLCCCWHPRLQPGVVC